MPASTAQRPPLADRIFTRDFGDREVLEALDAISIEGVTRALYGPNDDGTPTVHRTFAKGAGSWDFGVERPSLADDDPAVMQAIGRCAAYRLRLKLPGVMPLVAPAHPRECAWCELPMAELLRACDWATVTSRYVVTERLTWHQYPEAAPGDRGLAYHRSGRSGVCLDTRHADFWSLPDDEREARVAAAQYPEAA